MIAITDLIKSIIAETPKPKVDKAKKEKAFKLGQKAYHNDIKVPGMDKNLLDLMKGLQVGEGAPYIKSSI